MTVEDLTAAARLVALGISRRNQPSGSNDYAQLLDRYSLEVTFAESVRAIARGFGLEVIGTEPRAGLVLATSDDTEFKIAVKDLVSSTRDRPIYLLAHLVIASEAYPNQQDLDDDSHVGRVSVDGLDDRVREAIDVLDHHAREAGERTEPPADQPGLESMWRYYQRRPRSEGRITSTRSLIARALNDLRDHKMMTRLNDEDGGTYATTQRYRLQVRELAGYELFDELTELGLAKLPQRVLANEQQNDYGHLWHP